MIYLVFFFGRDHALLECDVLVLLGFQWVAHANLLKKLPFKILLVNSFECQLSFHCKELFFALFESFLYDIHHGIIKVITCWQLLLAQLVRNYDLVALCYVQQEQFFDQFYAFENKFQICHTL